jgi:23S rRNA pseudouridine1911/1915/1917 synthase
MAGEGFDIDRLEGPEEEYTFTVRRDEAGQRLDAVLAGWFKWLSRSEAKKLIGEGRVFVARGTDEAADAAEDRADARWSGAAPVTKGSYRLAHGDRVLLVYPRNPQDLEAARAAPPEKDLEILFEDECLIAVNKPAGLPVHPVGVNVFRTLLFALHKRCKEQSAGKQAASKQAGADALPILAHRLDVETSGVLLAVKGKKEAGDVTDQFRKRTVRKEYRALVYGAPVEDEGIVDLPLGEAEDARVPYKQAVRPEGAAARTRWIVERRGRRVSLVRLVPETGRKHQLRVHLAAIGHAVVGDKIYGPSEEHYFKARQGPPEGKDLEELILPRHALHSALLALRHPRSGEEIVFEAPLPDDMKGILEGGG